MAQEGLGSYHRGPTRKPWRRPSAEKETHGEFASYECPGECGAQDTFYVGTLKGVGRIYQQTFIDTYAKVACSPSSTRSQDPDHRGRAVERPGDPVLRRARDPALPGADRSRHRVLRQPRATTSTSFHLAIEDIDHTRTKARSPQTNGICERFHKTVLDEFYRIAFRKRIYATIEQLQVDLDAWMNEYNQASAPSSRPLVVHGKTPMCRPSLTPCRSPRRRASGPRDDGQSPLVGHPPRRECRLSDQIHTSTSEVSTAASGISTRHEP